MGLGSYRVHILKRAGASIRDHFLAPRLHSVCMVSEIQRIIPTPWQPLLALLLYFRNNSMASVTGRSATVGRLQIQQDRVIAPNTAALSLLQSCSTLCFVRDLTSVFLLSAGIR